MLWSLVPGKSCHRLSFPMDTMHDHQTSCGNCKIPLLTGISLFGSWSTDQIHGSLIRIARQKRAGLRMREQLPDSGSPVSAVDLLFQPAGTSSARNCFGIWSSTSWLLVFPFVPTSMTRQAVRALFHFHCWSVIRGWQFRSPVVRRTCNSDDCKWTRVKIRVAWGRIEPVDHKTVRYTLSRGNESQTSEDSEAGRWLTVRRSDWCLESMLLGSGGRTLATLITTSIQWNTGTPGYKCCNTFITFVHHDRLWKVLLTGSDHKCSQMREGRRIGTRVWTDKSTKY